MCGRYALYNTRALPKRFKTRPPPFKLRDSYNMAPGQQLPVIVRREHDRNIASMKWGLVPVWAKDPNIGYRMINARAEGLFEKPAWRGPIRRSRVLVPASGFYEWKSELGQTKRPFFIRPTDQEQFAFAGMYNTWRDDEGHELQSYAIITTTPNAEMANVHDRMPVILHPDAWDIWLDPSMQEQEVIEDLLRPYDDGRLDMYIVSTDVNSVYNNEEYLVAPLGSK